MKSSLHLKRVLITGASRGIGSAIAQRFAREGAICFLVARNKNRLEAVCNGLQAPPVSETGEAFSHHCEVMAIEKEDRWQWLKGELLKNSFPVDILVNAAGVTIPGPLIRLKPESLDTMICTNLRGTILGCQAVLPGMMRRRQGSIINIGSILANHGGAGSSVYAATKAGVLAFSRSLVAEVAHLNIRVNSINPGYIDTDMLQGIPKAKMDQILSKIPMKRLGTAEEVADAAFFLATNAYANGCVLDLDGGYRMAKAHGETKSD